MIKCLKYTSCVKGKLMGFATFYIPLAIEEVDGRVIDENLGITIRDCKLYRSDGRQWLNFPNRKFESEDGQVGWMPYILFSNQDGEHLKERKDAFDKAAIKAIERYCQEKNGQNTSAAPRLVETESGSGQPLEEQMDLPF